MATVLLNQIPTNKPGRAAYDGQSAWVPPARIKESDEVPGS